MAETVPTEFSFELTRDELVHFHTKVALRHSVHKRKAALALALIGAWLCIPAVREIRGEPLAAAPWLLGVAVALLLLYRLECALTKADRARRLDAEHDGNWPLQSVISVGATEIRATSPDGSWIELPLAQVTQLRGFEDFLELRFHSGAAVILRIKAVPSAAWARLRAGTPEELNWPDDDPDLL